MVIRGLLAGCILSLFSAAAGAAETLVIEKTKTGILPNGGFYGLYEVGCSAKRTASIGALSRRSGPWCVARQGDLQCFVRAQEAASTACHTLELAEAGHVAAPTELVQ